MLTLTKPIKDRDYWILAEGYKSRGQVQEAISAYEAALRESGNKSEILCNLGGLYRSVGDVRQAAECYRRAIVANPSAQLPHKALALLMISTGRSAEAVEELRRAASLDEKDPEAWALLGAGLIERGEREEGCRSLVKAQQLRPGSDKLRRLIEDYLARCSAGRSPAFSGTSLKR